MKTNLSANTVLKKLVKQYDNKKYSKKVEHFLNTFNCKIFYLYSIKDSAIRLYFVYMLYDDYRNNINKSILPDDLKSYTLNVISKKFKIYLKWFKNLQKSC